MKNGILNKTAVMMLTALVLGGCASDAEQTRQTTIGEIPQWVLNPTIKDGLAAAECVSWSGNFTVDREQATAFARANLTKQIALKSAAMDETYARRVDASTGSNVGTSFESTSKQVAEQELRLTRAVKVAPATINDEKQLCVLVTLEPAQTEKLFKKIVASSGTSLSAQDEGVLYEEFKAYKAQQRLKEAVSKQ